MYLNLHLWNYTFCTCKRIIIRYTIASTTIMLVNNPLLWLFLIPDHLIVDVAETSYAYEYELAGEWARCIRHTFRVSRNDVVALLNAHCISLSSILNALWLKKVTQRITHIYSNSHSRKGSRKVTLNCTNHTVSRFYLSDSKPGLFVIRDSTTT